MFGVKSSVYGLPLVLLTSTAYARPDRNAFLNHRVSSIGQLIQQIKTDKAVADRYMRHYAMSKSELIGYLSSLHAMRLDHAETFTIYSVPANGVVKMHRAKLKKGELMFATATNGPVLIAKCGNPVGLGPAAASPPNEIMGIPGNVPQETLRALDVDQDVPSDALMASNILPPDVPKENNDTGDVIPVNPPTTTTTVVPTIPIEPPSSFALPPSGFGSLFPGLIGLGTIGAIAINHGGDNNGAPVPEPTTLVAMGLGVASFAGLRRAKRSR